MKFRLRYRNSKKETWTVIIKAKSHSDAHEKGLDAASFARGRFIFLGASEVIEDKKLKEGE